MKSAVEQLKGRLTQLNTTFKDLEKEQEDLLLLLTDQDCEIGDLKEQLLALGVVVK